MAHVVAVDDGLGVRLTQGGHLHLGLLKLRSHQGIEQLRLRPLLKLMAVGGSIDHIKEPHHRGNGLCHDPAAGIENVGVNRSGVVKNAVNDRQSAKQKQGSGGFGHSVPGGRYKITQQEEEDGGDDDGIENLPRQCRSGDGGDDDLAKAGELAAEVAGADNHHRHRRRFLQDKDKNQQYREEGNQRVDLFGRL